MKRICIKKIFISLFLGLLFIAVSSPGTTILNNCNYGSDSAWIQVVAKAWVKGLIPYVDTFDHKGPLYFLIDAIGYSFPNTRLGLYLVQSIMMSTQIYLIIQGLELLLADNKKKILIEIGVVLHTLIFYSYTMCDGGLSEEYSCLFVFMALYFISKYFINYYLKSEREHNWRYAFIYGICFGALSMIRINNSLIICVSIAMIAINLIYNRMWKNIISNAVAALVGIVIVVIPFVVYFSLHGALHEFWYSVFEFNLNYMKIKEGSSTLIFRRRLFYMMPEVMLILTGLLSIRYKRYLIGITSCISAILMSYMLVSGAEFTHYFVLGVPMIYLAYFNLILCVKYFKCNISSNAIIVIPVIAAIIVSLVFGIHNFPRRLEDCFGNTMKAEMTEYNSQLKELMDNIPLEEYSDVAGYNIKGMQKKIYLVTDLLPAPRHAFATELHATYDYSVMDKTIDWLYENKPKWLFMDSDSSGEEIKQYIDSEGYSLVYQVQLSDEEGLSLYRIQK